MQKEVVQHSSSIGNLVGLASVLLWFVCGEGAAILVQFMRLLGEFVVRLAAVPEAARLFIGLSFAGVLIVAFRGFRRRIRSARQATAAPHPLALVLLEASLVSSGVVQIDDSTDARGSNVAVSAVCDFAIEQQASDSQSSTLTAPNRHRTRIGHQLKRLSLHEDTAKDMTSFGLFMTKVSPRSLPCFGSVTHASPDRTQASAAGRRIALEPLCRRASQQLPAIGLAAEANQLRLSP